MMDKADDTLFDLANKADSNVKQQLYFDAMRDIRLRRKHIEQQFIHLYKHQFELFATGKPLGRDLQEIIPNQEVALELLDDSNMEEDIALANMAARSVRENYQALYELTVPLKTASASVFFFTSVSRLSRPKRCTKLLVTRLSRKGSAVRLTMGSMYSEFTPIPGPKATVV